MPRRFATRHDALRKAIKHFKELDAMVEDEGKPGGSLPFDCSKRVRMTALFLTYSFTGFIVPFCFVHYLHCK